MNAQPQYALRRTIPASWAHLGALQAVIERQDLRAVGEYLCIVDLAPTHGRRVVCCINGEYISRADWWQPVRRGDVVVFADVAGDGDSDVGRFIAQLAVIALSIYTGGVAGAVIGVVGSMAVNLLFPMELPKLSGREQSPTYTATLQGNQPRMGQPVPVRYGQENFFPDWACPAYSEFEGAEFHQYYCTGLAIGLGEYEVLGIYIDDTPLQHFKEVQVAIVGPGQAARAQPTGYTGVETWADQTVIETGMVTTAEVAGQEINDAQWIGPYTALAAGWRGNRLYVDVVLPRGLGNVASDGDINDRSIQWQVQAQLIDDDGAASGSWFVLGTETYTNSTTQQVRLSYGYDVAAGRYRVRMRRMAARSDNDRHLNDLQWAQLRARLDVDGIARTDLTGAAIRIRATSQLSGMTQRRVKVLARRLLPVYDGDAWSAVQFARNPAWALADIWRNTVYGRGLPDDRVDLESLLDYAGVWTERQDRFDFSFDTQLTTDDAAQLVAAAGRARTMLRRGAVYSLVRDEAQDTPAAVFMPRNIDQDSFSLTWALPTSETPDCVEATYRDGRFWAPRKVYAQIHNGAIVGYAANAAGVPLRPAGVPAPTIVEEVEFKGIVGQKQALRQVAYVAARMLYRRVEGSIAADLDALLVSMGSLVAMAHDAADWGQSGDVVAWNAGTLTMTLSEPPQWTEGQTHYIRLQTHTGEPGGAIEVTPGATAFEVVLAAAPAQAPSVADADRERTRYLFGALADVQRSVVVASLRPTAADTVELGFFLEDARVHEADAPWLPSLGEEQDPLGDGSLVIDDGGVGVGDIVNLVGFAHWILVLGDVFVDQRITVNNDGRLSVSTTTSELLSYLSQQWLVPQPVTAAVAALYEVMFEDLTDVPEPPADALAPTGGAALGVWHSLAVSRSIDWYLNSPSYSRTYGVRIRIRDAATLAELDVAEYSWHAENNSP